MGEGYWTKGYDWSSGVKGDYWFSWGTAKPYDWSNGNDDFFLSIGGGNEISINLDAEEVVWLSLIYVKSYLIEAKANPFYMPTF